MAETKVEEELGNRVQPYYLLRFFIIIFIHSFISKEIWAEAIQLCTLLNLMSYFKMLLS